MLQTARAPLGVSGLLDAAAGGLFCSVTFMILRFWLTMLMWWSTMMRSPTEE